jgi:predicted GH43/DUF377 family glycosyl hydrolase
MGNDHVSRLGYASSSDGYHFNERLPHPVFSPMNDSESDGCEDPRLTLLDNSLVMAYTAFGYYASQRVYQVALTSITVQDFVEKRWSWDRRRLVFPGIRNKNGLVFPRKIRDEYVLFHRLGLDVCIAHSSDLQRWYDIEFVMGTREKRWDSWKIGTTGPPIELNEGWLFIYHGVNYDRVYSLGAALLDRDNPKNVLYRSEKPILTPEEDYERFGTVPNVVYSCGSVLMDNRVLVYYGGADSVLCVATYEVSELLPKR